MGDGEIVTVGMKNPNFTEMIFNRIFMRKFSTSRQVLSTVKLRTECVIVYLWQFVYNWFTIIPQTLKKYQSHL